jgi:hypothetical protein
MATLRMTDEEILEEVEALLEMPADRERLAALNQLHEFLRKNRQQFFYLVAALHDDLLRTVDTKVDRQ